MDASLSLGPNKKNHSLLSCVVRGILVSALLMLLLLLAATAIAYRSDDPAAKVTPLAYAAALLTFLLGGLLSARRRGRQGLICGGLTGLGLVMLFLVGYLVMLGDGEADLGRLLLSYSVLLAVSILGGGIGSAMPAGGARRVRHPKRR